jgi:DNA-binding MarR family transcriptional regulator
MPQATLTTKVTMPAPHLDHETAQRVSFALIRLTKLLQAIRQHAPRIHPAVDTTAYPLLFNLAVEPRRVSALADCIHSDISTVSRQVSTLVGYGLLDKVSDPADGRAQVVALSAEGHDLLKRIKQQRIEWFREVMDDWTADEARHFAAELERFGAALESSKEQLLARRLTGAGTADTAPDAPSEASPDTSLTASSGRTTNTEN